jgi:hypothetical protein
MGFSLPWFQQKKGKVVLVLSIGERALHFILFEEKGEEVRVLTSGQREVYLSNLEQILVDLFAQLTKSARIRDMVVSFSSEIFKAQIIKEPFVRSTPKHSIDAKEAKRLEEKIRTRAKRSFNTILFEDSGILPGDFDFRSMQVLSHKVDGYEVVGLEGYKGSEVEFTLLGTFLLRKPFAVLKKAAKRYRIEHIQVVHIAEALVKYSEQKEQDGVFLSIEHTRTQVIISRGDNVALGEPIPAGEEHFLEVFGEGLGMKENIASEFQDQYFRGELSDILTQKVKALLLPEVKNFGTLVLQELEEAKISLPEQVWIFGSGSNIGDITGLFEHRVKEEFPFSEPPSVAFLLPQHIRAVKDFPGSHNPSYTGLFLLYESKTH